LFRSGCLRKNEEYGDKNFGKKRSEIEKLSIGKQKLEGFLDLSDFSSLKVLYCSENRLTNLNLSNCSQLEEIVCSNNNFSSEIKEQLDSKYWVDIHKHFQPKYKKA